MKKRAIHKTCAHGHTKFRIIKTTGRRQCIECNRAYQASHYKRAKKAAKNSSK